MKPAFLFVCLLFGITLYAQSYDKKWEKIISHENNNELKQASDEVAAIYALARKNHDEVQIIKAFFFVAKYTHIHEEGAVNKILNNLRTDIRSASPATAALLQSIYGGLLNEVYLRDQYNISRRTDRAESTPDNIDEWTSKNFKEAIEQAYATSVANRELLYKTPLSKYNNIIDFSPAFVKINRSLYDFLAERYTDYLTKRNDNQFINADKKHTIALLGTSDAFIKTYQHKDQFKNNEALIFLHETETFYTNKGDVLSLQAATLRRLMFIENRVYVSNRNEELINTFKKFYDTWDDTPHTYNAGLKLAELYNVTASKKLHPEYKTKALEICNYLIKNAKKHNKGSQAINLKNSIVQQSVSLETENYITPEQPALAKVTFKNIEAVKVRFYKIKNANIYTHSNRYNSHVRTIDEDSLPAVASSEKIYTLPIKPNHFEYTTEIILPPLPKGSYRYVVSPVFTDSTSDKRLSFGSIQATALTLIQQNVNDHIRYRIVKTDNGEPVKGVTGKTKNQSFVSDSNGFVTIKNADDPKNRNIDITFTHQGDTLQTVAYLGRYLRDDIPSAMVNLYLDRDIYRPGQTVNFKGILTKNDNGKYTIVPNVFVSVTVDNSQGNEIKTFRLKTNEFGSFTGEFVLPMEHTGEFDINVDEDYDMESDPAYDEKEDEHPFWDRVNFNGNSLTFRVEEYKRPTFEITFDPIKDAVKIGDSIRLSGHVKSFSGAPVSGSDIDYRVRRTSYYNLRDTYYDNFDKDESGELLDEDDIITDANGNFTITFVAEDENDNEDNKEEPLKNRKHKKTLYYTIYTDVTDINGETQTKEFTVTAANYILDLSASVPNIIKSADGGKITLNTQNTNNQFIAAKGKVVIYKMSANSQLMRARPWQAPEIQTIDKAEFKRLFPYIPYQFEKDSAVTDKVYFEKNVNTAKEKEVIINNLKNWPEGKYQVVFTAKDTLGVEEKTNCIFKLEHEQLETPTERLFSLSIVNTDPAKDGYVAIEVRSALPVVHGILQAYANDKFSHDKTVVVQKGKQIFKIPLVKNPYTLMAVSFSFVWQNELFTKSINTPIHKWPAPVTVVTETLNSKLLPGSGQTWSFTLKEGNKKAEAELLATMYDTSLDQFIKKNWGMPDTYSYTSAYVPNSANECDGTGYGNFSVYGKTAYNNQKEKDELYTFGFNIIKYNNNIYSAGPKGRTYAPGRSLVSGVVTDTDNMPIPGVNIIVEGTTEGTLTDFDGNFSIYISEDEKLLISYIGMEEITIKPDKSEIKIKLKAMDMALEEVVVVGYGVQRKQSTTGVVTSKALEGRPNANFIQTLQGQVPGLHVSTGSGQPGAHSSVILRGYGDINSTAEPLYVIDGVPLTAEQFRELSSDDITNVTVLKNAEATPIYGNRGANGVIIISTKKMMTDAKAAQQELESLKKVDARKNFNETAFFYPQLLTDKKGNIIFSFTMPEALTEWKLRLLAHNKKAVFGYLEKEFFTQKDLMIVPNMPRFLRETDTVTISAKITNMTAEVKSGNALLQLFDAVTMTEKDAVMQNNQAVKSFTIGPNASTTVNWTVTIPEGLQGIQYKVVARSGDFSDGEENILPVLPNNVLVTESVPLWVREHSTKTYTLENLKNNTSSTLRHHGITVEYTGNPAWTALQSLPYLIEYEHDCTEQTFSRFYANAIAASIISSNPKIGELFDVWREKGAANKLEQNDRLKNIVLAETPWLLDAQDKETQNKRLALLMDLDKMAIARTSALEKLKQKQLPSGGFPWFSEGRADYYITRHILSGFGHLYNMRVLSSSDSTAIKDIINRAIPFADAEFEKEYKNSLANVKNRSIVPVSYSNLHYLYMRSFYLKQFSLSETVLNAFKASITTMKKDWKNYSLYQKAMAALVFHRYNESGTAKQVLTYLKETASNNTDWGMYWIDNKPGWYWYQAPVETQALIIEAFNEVNSDTKSVDAMKVWLLKQKQNKSWPTTRSTTEAVYALLMQGTKWLDVKNATSFKLGDEKIIQQKLAGSSGEEDTGYVKLQWKPEEITPGLSTLTIENKSEVSGYGGFYWQYFEQADKVKSSQKDILNISKQLYVKDKKQEDEVLKPISTGSTLNVGDLVTVRLVIDIKEDMEYVHLKDMRAAGMEPVDVLSEHHYNAGLRYYKSTRDAATHFFFDNITRGTYVLEYDVRINNAGSFANGITTIQSMYAPEFSAHTAGIRMSTE